MRQFFPGREQFVQLTIFPPGALRTRGGPKGTKTGSYYGKFPLRIPWESGFFGSPNQKNRLQKIPYTSSQKPHNYNPLWRGEHLLSAPRNARFPGWRWPSSPRIQSADY